MYKIQLLKTPKGVKLNDHIKDLYLNAPREEAKDKIFRLTYYIAIEELHKYKHLIPIEDALGELSVAYIKTFNNFDPHNEKASFLNYYKLAIRSEVITAKFRKYKNDGDTRELCMRMENNFEYLDEPSENKDGRETTTLGETIPSPVNVECSILNKNTRDKVREIANKAFDIYNKKSDEKYRSIFVTYMVSATTDDPLNGKDLARLYNMSYYNIRRMIIRYTPIFKELWKGEYDYENR